MPILILKLLPPPITYIIPTANVQNRAFTMDELARPTVHAKHMERFDKLMPPDANDLHNILRGHLLIEEQLLLTLKTGFPRPELIDKATLSFACKLYLARAVAGPYFDDDAAAHRDR